MTQIVIFNYQFIRLLLVDEYVSYRRSSSHAEKRHGKRKVLTKEPEGTND